MDGRGPGKSPDARRAEAGPSGRRPVVAGAVRVRPEAIAARRGGGTGRIVRDDPRDAVRRPGASAAALDLLTPDRGRGLLEGFNQTAAEFPREIAIHGLFETQAGRWPDRPALVGADGRLTYRELNARANQVAHRLRRYGVGPGVTVGLCTSRSAEMIIALLGILKAGGAYVPLHPDQPRARLGHQLAESGAGARDAAGSARPAPRIRRTGPLPGSRPRGARCRAAGEP